MTELIIAEKPSSAKKIAEALGPKPMKETYKGASYYSVTRGDKEIVVACALGHLFGLAEEKKSGLSYPVFDVVWKPIYEVDKNAKSTKKFVDMLKKLSKEADSFVVACDYDIEGTIIGYNVIRYACKQKDAKRMKFSTLTKEDLERSYEEASPSLDWGQAFAGETRHEMDWYYGINVSRALTSSIKKAGMFKIISAGRVQAPALHIVVEREKEIRAFKPDPFWQIDLKGDVRHGQILATHEKDKFWAEAEAKDVLTKCQGKDGSIASVKKDEFRQAPPSPFDLTTLQTESYSALGINPKQTLEVAQDLYTSGYISYPRTSSQQLPESLGFANILKQLAKQEEYKDLCDKLLKGPLKPNNGKKTDPAHPAIFPTGARPKNLEGRKQRLYDLIARRFMSTFAEPAVRETVTAKIDVAGEPFISKGTTTKRPGWHEFYGPFVKVKEEELPKMKEGEAVSQIELTKQDRETQPPKRYTQASLVREMEKRNLGTKATRASTVDTLIQRGYVTGKAIEATELGMHTVEVLGKYVPEIIDEDLTRHFEEEMQEIQNLEKKGGAVLKEVKTILTKILDEFKHNEEEIGKGLYQATKDSDEKANTIGPCQKCDGILMIKKGKFGKFIACSKYPDCTATFKLPATGMVKNTEKICDDCNHPKILMIRKAKKPQEVCINPDCPTKKLESDLENQPCPKCKKGKMVIRKSVYGQFLGCDNFPKCRNIMKG